MPAGCGFSVELCVVVEEWVVLSLELAVVLLDEIGFDEVIEEVKVVVSGVVVGFDEVIVVVVSTGVLGVVGFVSTGVLSVLCGDEIACVVLSVGLVVKPVLE